MAVYEVDESDYKCICTPGTVHDVRMRIDDDSHSFGDHCSVNGSSVDYVTGLKFHG